MTKIKVTWNNKTYSTVAEAIIDRIDRYADQYRGGELERMEAAQRSLVQFVANLTELLYNKGVITEDEIEKFLPPWY